MIKGAAQNRDRSIPGRNAGASLKQDLHHLLLRGWHIFPGRNAGASLKLETHVIHNHRHTYLPRQNCR
ncbi:MAG: hypothetical protein ACK5TB_02660, partial [bacterium]